MSDAEGDEGLIALLPEPVRPDLDPVAIDDAVDGLLASELRAFPFLTEGLTGRVLDVGAGSGAAIPHVERHAAPDVTVHCLDPGGFELHWARSRVAAHDVAVHVERGRGESLPYADDAFDAVVCKEVLCAVDDPVATLSELRRVLRPAGELRYLEHVRSDGVAGRVEDHVAPYWREFSGCDVDRPTDETLADSEFEVLEQHRYTDVGLCPPWTYVAGVARPA